MPPPNLAPSTRTRAPSPLSDIPPNIVMFSEFEELKSMFTKLQVSMKEDFKVYIGNELDTREVGGSGYAQSIEIMTKLGVL